MLLITDRSIFLVLSLDENVCFLFNIWARSNLQNERDCLLSILSSADSLKEKNVGTTQYIQFGKDTYAIITE